jgi:hypothetical protein
MMTHNTLAKSTIVILLSVFGILLLSLVVSGSASAISVKPGLHQVIPASIKAPQASGTLIDSTVADFQAGLDCYTAPSDGGDSDGELILTPTVGVTFTGSLIPTGWYTNVYTTTGSGIFGGGVFTAAGAYAGTSDKYPPADTGVQCDI